MASGWRKNTSRRLYFRSVFSGEKKWLQRKEEDRYDPKKTCYITLVFQSYLLRFGVWMVCFWGPNTTSPGARTPRETIIPDNSL